MTNQSQDTETISTSMAPEPEIMPRLVLLFITPVIGVVVAFSFDHVVSIYDYRMRRNVIKLEGNQEQFEKTDGGKFSQTPRREELSYSLTDNLGDEALKMIKNSKSEFYYRLTFTDKELTKSHFYTELLLPTENGKCERVLPDGSPTSPVEDTSSINPAEEVAANRENREPVMKCNYPINFDDYLAWKIAKPRERKDWTNK